MAEPADGAARQAMSVIAVHFVPFPRNEERKEKQNPHIWVYIAFFKFQGENSLTGTIQKKEKKEHHFSSQQLYSGLSPQKKKSIFLLQPIFYIFDFICTTMK